MPKITANQHIKTNDTSLPEGQRNLRKPHPARPAEAFTIKTCGVAVPKTAAAAADFRNERLLRPASRLFAAMLDDIVVDVALQSHQEVARNRRKCDVCHTQCVFFFTPRVFKPQELT